MTEHLHGGVSSHYQLEKAAVKAGIKPIFGCELYCGPVDAEHRGQFKNHLTVLAKDGDGYRSLNRIVTQSYLDHHYHPTVSGRSLQENAGGLIVLSGCSGSLLACTLLGGKGIPEKETPDMCSASLVIERFIATFGDSYFLEVQAFPELERTCVINKAYEKLSKETGVPIVATMDVHYPRPEDAEMQAVLHAVHRGKATVDDQMRQWNYDVLLTLPSSDKELASRLEATGLSRKAAWSAIETSADIAEQCNVTLPKASRLKYPISGQDMVPWI